MSEKPDHLTRIVTAAIKAALEHVSVVDDHWFPLKPEWRTYQGFRDFMVAEQHAAEDLGLKIVGRGGKVKLAGYIGVHPRTITRAMKHYGLSPRMWPPTAWPLEDPRDKLINGHALAASVVGMANAWWVLDLVSDNRLDEIVRVVCWVAWHGMRHATM